MLRGLAAEASVRFPILDQCPKGCGAFRAVVAAGTFSNPTKKGRGFRMLRNLTLIILLAGFTNTVFAQESGSASLGKTIQTGATSTTQQWINFSAFVAVMTAGVGFILYQAIHAWRTRPAGLTSRDCRRIRRRQSARYSRADAKREKQLADHVIAFWNRKSGRIRQEHVGEMISFDVLRKDTRRHPIVEFFIGSPWWDERDFLDELKNHLVEHSEFEVSRQDSRDPLYVERRWDGEPTDIISTFMLTDPHSLL